MSTTPTTSKPKSKSNERNNISTKQEIPNENAVQIFPFAIGMAAVYILICFLMNDAKDNVGGIGVFIRNTFYGLFSNAAFLIPFMMGSIAFFLKKDLSSGFCKYRLIFSAVCLILYSALIHLFSSSAITPNEGFSISAMFEKGKNYIGGGAVGGTISEILTKGIGTIGAGIFIISLSVIFSIFLFGYTPLNVIKFFATLVHEYRDYKKNKKNGFNRELIVKCKDPNRSFKMKTHKYRISSRAFINSNKVNKTNKPSNKNNVYESEQQAQTQKQEKSKKTKAKKEKVILAKSDDAVSSVKILDLETKPREILSKPLIEPMWIPEKSSFESLKSPKSDEQDKNPKTKTDTKADMLNTVDDIFFSVSDTDNYNDYMAETSVKTDSEAKTSKFDEELNADEKKSDLTFETSKIFEKSDEDSLSGREYKLPPLSYLSRDTSNNANIDVSRELHITSSRLIDTLESFGVKTKVSAISRGPSVTRYEITPNAGVKVKSIVNLIDDIALNLAAGGVRIEAPIPGKAAVGIEVPNKNVSTVYLRTLLENPQFRQMSSKITVALGMDVAGNPIYSDISKMPHLLISGATGMGKSVCINSIITSILYKANPNEVKLILIDPKKVELTIYNGIPHLLVPVVSDPKKAAGSLNWAVSEMENRFLLIEEKGVRDLKSYNDAVSIDPLAEKLPQIIIVIDELADLMMTAPADVEQAICRLAQKARAAGMHLIVGTQRPSVDVITGLIKANIPSRIAFTVASQIDSRTIIDTKGAEELIGRGDMLYLPVGASKPMRVQGAYVSEKDVMNVTEFLKKQSDGGYNEQILTDIEREAQNCNTKGAKLQSREIEISENVGEEIEKEPMLKSAIEIAVDSGTVSTSLLQRELNLGYQRAARIIDKMEKMNVIGPFEGSKPRKTLITRDKLNDLFLSLK